MDYRNPPTSTPSLERTRIHSTPNEAGDLRKAISADQAVSRNPAAHAQDDKRKIETHLARHSEQGEKPPCEQQSMPSSGNATSNRLRRKLDAQFGKARRMVVITYGSADDASMHATMRSIEAQTLPDIEVIAFADGNCNDRLASTGAEYVMFCASGDTLPPAACETLRRKMLVEDADMAIGREESVSSVNKAIDESSARLSKKDRINKHDIELNASLHVGGKLFRRSIIVGHKLQLGADRAWESAFVCEYARFAHHIVGCPSLTYRRKAPLNFGKYAALSQIHRDEVEGLFTRWSRAKTIRLESARRDINALAQTNKDRLLSQRIEASATLLAEDIDYRALREAIGCFYRNMWLLDAEALDFLIDKLETLRDLVYPEHWDTICELNSDLALQKGFERPEAVAAHPLVTIAITPQKTAEGLAAHLRALLQGGFPAFELIMSQSCQSIVPDWIADKPHVRFLDASSPHAFIKAAVKSSRAYYLNVLDDRIYHTSSSLCELYGAVEQSRADFVCAQPKGISPRTMKARNLPAIEFMYSDEFAASPSHRSRFCAIDHSWNNKMFKTSRLAGSFPDDRAKSESLDAAKLFDLLSFEKMPGITMACLEANGYFTGNLAEPAKTAFKMARRWRDKHPFRLAKTQSQQVKRHLREQVLFCSNRENGRLSTNMQLVHDALVDADKAVFCEPLPHPDTYLKRFRTALAQAKVIVTDDYIHELRTLELDKLQTVIQLWHACGALKTFGLDNPACNIKREIASHRQYSAVMVSDESVRGVYARAFGIEEDNVLAFGVPRTDLLLSDEHRAHARNEVLHAHPEFRGKQVILYCPTFRERNGKQVNFNPHLNWAKLDTALGADQIFIVKKHPLEKSDLCPNSNLEHICTADDITSDALLVIADLLVTDCSSIVYDYSLLDRPMVFYFPDRAAFSRDFYIDFPEDLGGRILSSDDELIAIIQDALANPSKYMISDIRNGMMSACDGHSTERIAAYVKSALNR